MRILKATANNVLAASQTVKNGGLVVYPTDTVYGLGCDPFNVDAVKRVFGVKRERKKPLPILSCCLPDLEKIVYLSEKAKKLAERFWPGSLTLVVPKKPVLPDIVTCNLDSVGVRIPKHEIALQLICQSGGLLIGTSANKTGKEPPQTAHEAAEQLGREVDIILDGGPTPVGASSTVVDLTAKKMKILREGPISLQQILDALS